MPVLLQEPEVVLLTQPQRGNNRKTLNKLSLNKMHRPYIGKCEFNIHYLSSDESEWSGNLAVTLHEIHHILVFSQSYYTKYIDPATNALLTGVTE